MSDSYIREGAVSIHAGANLVGKIAPPEASITESATAADSNAESRSKDTLFYNPAQVFNRDLSLLVARVFARRRINRVYEKFDEAPSKLYIGKEVRGLTFCEPLAATCLRSLRYALELPPSIHQKGVAGDLSAAAVNGGKANASLNKVDEAKIKIIQADANDLMFAGKFVTGDRNWDVVDLDPYGTIAPFIDAGVRAVAPEGLLCVTSTDMPILGGNAPEVSFYKYGGNTVKCSALHEMSLRLVIHSVQMAAAKIRRYAQPILSCSVDFYVRIWFKMHDQPKQCSNIARQTGVLHHCANCDWFTTSAFGSTATFAKNTERNKKRRLSKRDSQSNGRDNEEPSAQASAQDEDQENGEANSNEPAGAVEGELPHKAASAELRRVIEYPGYSTEPVEGKFVLGKLSEELISNSSCPECGSRIQLAGPAYMGPLQDYDFVRELLAELPDSPSSNPILCGDLGDDTKEAPRGAEKEVPRATESMSTSDSLPEPKLVQEDISSSTGRTACAKKQGLHFESDEHALAWVKRQRAIFDSEYKQKLIQFSPKVLPKIRAILTAMLDEEAVKNVPFFYRLSSICNKAHISLIKADRFRSALLNMGYRVGLFHREAQSFKTDAPAEVVFSIIRKWIADEVVAKGHNTNRIPERFLRPLSENCPAISFDYSQDLNKYKGPRFLANPEAHWGPGRRAAM